MNVSEGMDIRDLAGAVRRRLLLSAGVAGATLLAAIFVAAILPNRYEAFTTLLVSPQTVSKKLVEPGVEESELNQRLHLMTMQILSRGRLSRVIDDLKLYVEESKEMTREEVIGLMRSHIRVEAVLPELQEGARRQQEGEINTFRLYYRSDSSKSAADVAARLATDFIDEHIRERVELSTGTSEFMEVELERLAREIQQVEERMAGIKNENVGRLPENLDANQRLLERMLGDLRFAQRDLAVAESDAAFYRQQSATGASGRYQGFSADTPSERKQRLEIALGEAYGKGFTEKHPDVITIKEEIALLEKTIAAGGMDEASLSPEQHLAQNEARRAELRAESSRAEIARLSGQVDQIQERLARTPQVAEQLIALERQHQHLSQSFQEFSAKRLEAGVTANMERRQKGEQFRILEAAFPPPRPISPNRPMIAILGLVLGIGMGVGAAVVAEMADSSLHGARDTQAATGLPVLVSIPKVLLEYDRRRLRRRRLAVGAAAVGIGLMGLIGAGAGYWMVNGGPRPAAEGAPPTTGGVAPGEAARG